MTLSDTQVEAMCRAHDAEEAAQRGEPSPWDNYDPRSDENEFRICRMVCMRTALEVLADEIDRLTRLVAEGEEALGPSSVEPIGGYDDRVVVTLTSGKRVTAGDFRRAAEVRQRMKTR